MFPISKNSEKEKLVYTIHKSFGNKASQWIQVYNKFRSQCMNGKNIKNTTCELLDYYGVRVFVYTMTHLVANRLLSTKLYCWCKHNQFHNLYIPFKNSLIIHEENSTEIHV